MRGRHSNLAYVILFMFVTFGCTPPSENRKPEPPRPTVKMLHEVLLDAPTVLAPNSSAAMRVAVLQSKGPSQFAPAQEATITAAIIGKETYNLFSAKTPSGFYGAKFKVPAIPEGEYKLKVHTESVSGSKDVETSITLKSNPKIMLVTDKPLYQPGQEVRIRALALDSLTMCAYAAQDLTFEIEDSKNNKLFRKLVRTSDFGVASVDFQLADEVNMGSYKISAILGKAKAEKSVEVKNYVLPRFKIEIKTDKTFYAPKENVKGSLKVDYFFGQPVADADVTVKAQTYDVQMREFSNLTLKTDDKGKVEFEVKIPDYFVGQPLDKGNAFVEFEVSVVDKTDHMEKSFKKLNVSASPLLVYCIPESGKIVPGFENTVYLVAVYPDGSPAQASFEIQVGEALAKCATRESGAGTFTFMATKEKMVVRNDETTNWQNKALYPAIITGKDKNGNATKVNADLFSEPVGDNFLMRLDKATYKQGEDIRVDIHSTSAEEMVYVDFVKKGQTQLSTICDISNHRGALTVPATTDLAGCLEIHAYKLRPDGNFVRDSRIVYVQPSSDLNVKIDLDKKTYLPGKKANISFHVTDSNNCGVESCLGVIIVDEAVYAIQDMQPGLEKLYFTLEQELLKPQYQIKFGTDIETYIRDVEEQREEVGKALFANVTLEAPASHFQVNTIVEKSAEIDKKIATLASKVIENIDSYKDNLEKISTGYSIPCFNLDQIVEPSKDNDDVVAYGFAYLKSATAQSVQLRVGSDDGLMVWLNGSAVINNPHAWRGCALDQDAATVNIKEGWNKLLLRVADRNGAWGFVARLTDSAGKPAVGITQSIGMKDETPLASGGAVENWLLLAPFSEYGVIGGGSNPKSFIEETKCEPREGLVEGGQGWFAQRGGNYRIEQRALREDIVETMLKDGKLKAEEALDPWGNTISTKAIYAKFPWLTSAPWGSWQYYYLGEEDFEGAANGERLDFRGKGRELRAFAAGGIPPGAKMDRAEKLLQKDPAESPATKETGGGAPPVRIREWFPETMYWNPSVITGKDGRATISVDLADSITTWRLSAMANSKGGMLGSSTSGVTVFQDFFCDVDFPRFLTQNDAVSVPVQLFNYLEETNSIHLKVEQQAWFELLDKPERDVVLKPKQVSVEYFRVKVREIGSQEFTVWAIGSKLSDAVKRDVEVLPDGKRVEEVVNETLKENTRHEIFVPGDSIAGSSKIMFKLYPGILAQILDGLDGMLHMPGG